MALNETIRKCCKCGKATTDLTHTKIEATNSRGLVSVYRLCTLCSTVVLNLLSHDNNAADGRTNEN